MGLKGTCKTRRWNGWLGSGEAVWCSCAAPSPPRGYPQEARVRMRDRRRCLCPMSGPGCPSHHPAGAHKRRGFRCPSEVPVHLSERRAAVDV